MTNGIKSLFSQKSKTSLPDLLEGERQRIGRDFLSSPLHQLTDFLMSLDRHIINSQQSHQPDVQAIGRKLAELRQSGLTILQSIRDCLYAVPLPAWDIHDLRAALYQDVIFLSERTGLDIQLDIQGDYRPLPPEQATALYRIMHEALVNVYKHAQARRAWVQLDFGQTEVRLTVRDDGCGFDPTARFLKKNHLGLKTMRERAHLAGGRFTVESHPGQGTSVQVSLPLPTAPAAVPKEATVPVMKHLSKVLESSGLLV
jgi:signal transduction histidine kinase